jgi:DNA-binding protein YbaB
MGNDSVTDYTAWAADVSDQVTQLRRNAHQAQLAVGQVRGHATAANGAIDVEVNARGRIQTLHLTRQALQLAPAELSAKIIDCIRQAEQDACRAAAEAAGQFTEDPRTREATELLDSFTAEDRAEPTSSSSDDYFEQLNSNPLGDHRGL